MDGIFGRENFVNEIVWHYGSGGILKNFAKTATILFIVNLIVF